MVKRSPPVAGSKMLGTDRLRLPQKARAGGQCMGVPDPIRYQLRQAEWLGEGLMDPLGGGLLGAWQGQDHPTYVIYKGEQSGASPEQAMALAEGGVATLMGASRRVAGLLGGVDGMGGTDEDDGGDVGRRKSVADAQVWMRAAQFIILSPLGQRLGILAVAWIGGRDGPASDTRRQCAGGADAEGLGWLSEA
ncbi:hypothetical protein CYMTET_56608 [Cymbomonas tetramitiformis]|uniref:Uncharacterized protein n=1 Tax=Cymbomonas tetramitiformis TaxID=36881 RepID=A0AAE0BBS1_9CHLO|nr:hypothetical protein CYMTET_56608 [Cymbomonas tetramitiformis]